MDEYTNLKAAEETPHEKIKAFNPQIVISTKTSKPYYGISYYDITEKAWFEGFGSYSLDNVRKWLSECFEEVEICLGEVIRCQECTIKKAVPHKNGIVWRCPHRTHDVQMEGYCESGVRANGS